MASPLERAFYLRFDARGGTETALVSGTKRFREANDALVERHRAPLSRLLDGLGAALRALGLLLVASPLFMIAKLVIAAVAGPRASDIVIPFFVVVVVAFFALLNVTLLVFVLHWVRRDQCPPPTFVPVVLGAGEPPSANAAVGAAVLARGKVVPLDESGSPMVPGEVVLRSADARTERGVARLVEMRCFAVVPDDDRTPPVIVRGPWAPLVVTSDFALEAARFGDAALALADSRDFDAEGAGLRAGTVIRAGDRVAVAGVVDALIANADRFVLDDFAASLPREGDEPYRGGAPRLALAIERVTLEKL
jgi:hypothetical protein